MEINKNPFRCLLNRHLEESARIAAHQKIHIPQRKIYQQSKLKTPNLAAVLILIFEKNKDFFIPFIIRKKIIGDIHSGQIAFPGGKKEKTDKNITDTALREAAEEIGINKDKVEILTQLSEIYIPPSNFLVTPIIGFYKHNPDFLKQESEVENIIEIPVNFLLQKDNLIYCNIDNYRNVACYKYREYMIWGATAIILSECISLMQSCGINVNNEKNY